MWGFGYDSYGFGWDDGPNRRNWSDKSAAASRREAAADRLFDSFLEKCAENAPTSTAFPITEEVVGADTHLTSACWTSFRKRVESKGCKAKRREATPAERAASKDTRQGKLYVISVTCPVHPTQAKAVAAEKKKKAEAAAAARKEKAMEAAKKKAEREKAEAKKRAERMRKEAEERERLAAIHRAKVREAYDGIMAGGGGARKKRTNPKQEGGDGKAAGGAVDTASILKHAETVHQGRLSEIRASIRKEECELLAQLREKQRRLEKEARDENEQAKQKIRDAAKEVVVDKENELNA